MMKRKELEEYKPFQLRFINVILAVTSPKHNCERKKE